jgi:hypothetical protein
MPVRHFYLGLFCLVMLISSRAAAQISYDNWNFLIKGVNSQITDSLAILGIRSDATSGYDNAYDVPRPPRSPSGVYLEVYFPHSGGNYPPVLGTEYARDFQGPTDPAWNMSVEASSPGPITLSWDSAYVNSIERRVQLFLFDITSGSLTNMKTAGRYIFAYTSKRDFQIIGAVKIDLRYLMEGFWNGTTQVQDTVRGYLSASASPFGSVDSATVFLSGTGTGLLVFRNAPSGSYYLTVHHRNHLEIWSAAPLPLVKGTTSISSYDFTAGAGTAFGTGALKQVGSSYVSWGGDVNQDGVIDFLDRNLTWNNRTLNGYLSTDCNGDQVTDSNDYTIVLANRLKVRQHP